MTEIQIDITNSHIFLSDKRLARAANTRDAGSPQAKTTSASRENSNALMPSWSTK
eukprot:CAMPEP_0183381626 /NCGR_PEP_ID=MMETSP0164_2-20130417/126536_1 /TAXON_ID=221442 /ORGANISM="Coccolithus pelagicus ssp braarudi, Strain PLY182g" /LENGTH=54 /DNA_ID=CAMNT_0025559237 /DNA_START=390 /DNA_END=554 /DNA_ORIENTATION=-